MGRSAGDVWEGLNALGVDASYIGAQPRSAITRLAATRLGRRLRTDALLNLEADAVRRAVPNTDWQLAFAISGYAPRGKRDQIVCIHQATCHPDLERARVRAAETATGGQGDFSDRQRRLRLGEIERVDLIRVTTQTVRQQFIDAGVADEKLIHSYPGVALERYRPGDKAGSLRLAFVGPLSLRKGVHIASEIVRRLPAGASLQVVGGPTDPWSRRVSDAAGFTVANSVPALLSNAHVFVLPSASDAFAYTVIEAMASGAVPVVSSRVGAAEVVRRIDERLVLDLDGFADHFMALLPELDLEHLAERGIAIAGEFERAVRAEATARAVVHAALDLLGSTPNRGAS